MTDAVEHGGQVGHHGHELASLRAADVDYWCRRAQSSSETHPDWADRAVFASLVRRLPTTLRRYRLVTILRCWLRSATG